MSSKSILAKAQVLANTRSTARKHAGRSIPTRSGCCAPDIENEFSEWLLWLIDRPARSLGDDLLGILVKRTRLRDRFHGLLYLWVGFEQHLEALLLSEAGHKHFLFDLPLDPVEALGHLGFRVPDVVLAQILAECSHHVVVHLKIFADCGLGAKVVARKSAHTCLGGEEHVVAVE